VGGGIQGFFNSTKSATQKALLFGLIKRGEQNHLVSAPRLYNRKNRGGKISIRDYQAGRERFFGTGEVLQARAKEDNFFPRIEKGLIRFHENSRGGEERTQAQGGVIGEGGQRTRVKRNHAR